MRSGARLRGLRSVASALVVLVALGPGRALAYRPFVSTDAAVAEPGEVEIELGSGFRERHGDGTVVAPTVIANLGLLRDVELVVETKASHDLAARGDRSQAEDTEVSMKWVAREGVLQHRGVAPSAAVELSLLAPTAADERHVGGELVGIVSGEAFDCIYHVNGGAKVDTVDGEPGAIWGVILEYALRGHLRAVAEVNGEAVRGSRPDDSALLGVIWDVAPGALHVVSLDAGVRRGISSAAADWGGTAGVTVAFPW